LRPAGIEAPTFGPFNFRLRPRRLYSIYAIGDLSGEFLLKAIEIPIEKKRFKRFRDNEADEDDDEDEG
jgi:hypothetical protein